MLTATNAAILNNKIAAHLNKTGKVNGMTMPRSSKNKEGYAWDYFIARKIEAYGKTAVDKARKDAIAAGVLFDTTKEPRDAGASELVWHGDAVIIMCNVRSGAFSLNRDVLKQALLSKGVSGTIVEECFGAAMKQNANAHVFTASLVTEG